MATSRRLKYSYPLFLARVIDPFFDNPVWDAVGNNWPENIVKALIKQGANPVHLRGRRAMIPPENLLLYSFGPPLAADYLSPLSLGARVIDVHRKDFSGRAMFNLIVEYYTIKTIGLRIQHGADPSIRTRCGEAPIEAATRAGREAVVKYLNSIPPRNPPLESESYRRQAMRKERGLQKRKGIRRPYVVSRLSEKKTVLQACNNMSKLRNAVILRCV
jgi:hypothetical protein